MSSKKSDGDLMGDGVNIAARLEGIAHPGAICLSEDAYRQVRARLDLLVNDLGETQLKNISEPVRVYSLEVGVPARAKVQGLPPAPEKPPPKLTLPDKPSIAVLPFQNMSGDPEQEYFADGLVEDLITNLSKNPGLFVIARNSTFAYRGKSVDVRQIARDLGVRYVLEGSVRKGGSKLRITAQLIEGAAGTHVWADKFEGALEDVFDLQDRLTENIAGAIEPSLRRAEIERARGKRPETLDAYDLYLRALPHVYANKIAETDKAIDLLDRALAIDENYAVAHAFAAWAHEQRFFRGGIQSSDRAAALRHADLAISLGPDDPQALSIGAFVNSNITHNYQAAIATLDRALRLNANSALTHGFCSLVLAFSENFDRAREHAEKALRLSPFDPLNYHPYLSLAVVGLFTDRAEEALANATLAVQSNQGFSALHALLIACNVRLARIDAARIAGQRLLSIAPDFTVSGFARMEIMRPQFWGVITDALREAGLPE